MAARNNPEEAHHAAPRCLVPLHERANGGTSLDGEGIQAWLEWEVEAMRWRVSVEISRSDLEALVASSEAVLPLRTSGRLAAVGSKVRARDAEALRHGVVRAAGPQAAGPDHRRGPRGREVASGDGHERGLQAP